MQTRKNAVIKYLSEMGTKIHPGFSIDCVIISFHEDELKILLNKLQGVDEWILPGGYMLSDDPDADFAAQRILLQRTGIKDVFLKQFHLFSDINRVDKAKVARLWKSYQIPSEVSEWASGRFISLGYYAFVDYQQIALGEKDDDVNAWFGIHELPHLIGDHSLIIQKALTHIHRLNELIPIGFDLLPEKFTISELRKVHESLLGTELDRRNFQKKVLASGYVEKLDERKEVNTYPKPYLFQYNREKLKESEIIQ